MKATPLGWFFYKNSLFASGYGFFRPIHYPRIFPTRPMFSVFADPFSNALVLILSSGVIALFTATVFRILIGMRSPGTEKMQKIPNQVRIGAMAFLRREYRDIGLLVVFVGAFLVGFIDTGFDNMRASNWVVLTPAGSFVLGAL